MVLPTTRWTSDMAIQYAESWQELRRLNRIERWVLATAVPGIVLFTSLAKLVGIDFAAPFIVGAWFIALWVSGQRALSFKCPRCEHRFFVRRGFRNGLASKCLNCGLPKWEPEGQSPEEFARETAADDPDDPAIGEQWKGPPS